MKSNPITLSLMLGIGALAGWYLSTKPTGTGKKKNGLVVALGMMIQDSRDVITSLRESVLKEISFLNIAVEGIEQKELAQIIKKIISDIEPIKDMLDTDQQGALANKLAGELQAQKSKLTKLIE